MLVSKVVVTREYDDMGNVSKEITETYDVVPDERGAPDVIPYGSILPRECEATHCTGKHSHTQGTTTG